MIQPDDLTFELDDKPHEECGVFAVYQPEPADIVRFCHLGIFALQHRGQESCGIAVSDGDELIIEKDMGLVAEVFNETRLAKLQRPGLRVGVGHTRYATTGASLRFNAQPLTVRSNKGILALAHNGNFTNAKSMRQKMMGDGAVFNTTNDTEVMINLIARYSKLSLEDATAQVMGEFEGGFAVVIMDKQKILGLRDSNGVRPLVIGELNGGYVFASEPSALHVIGATFLRDVRPGELVMADEYGLHSRQVLTPKPTPCAFEWIYFARGDSVLDGIDVHASRLRMGEALAAEAPVDADVVVGVPESGLTAAVGYARASGIPYDLGLYKSPYAGRTFINPTQDLRKLKVLLKLAPTGAVRGKRVVLVDDSIVRGTTSGHIVQLLRSAGATEVHFRVSSPPIRYPCYYGIDTAARKELAAATMTTEEIRDLIGADSLAYISEPGLAKAIGLETTCLACFDGSYPAGHPEEAVMDDEQLALPVFNAIA